MASTIPNSVPLEVNEMAGGLYVTSDDIPGFHLFSRNPIQLIEDIPKVAEDMLRDNKDLNAEVTLVFAGGRPVNDDQAYGFLTGQPRIKIVF